MHSNFGETGKAIFLAAMSGSNVDSVVKEAKTKSFNYLGFGSGQYVSKTNPKEQIIDFPVIVLNSGHEAALESFFARGVDFWGEFSLLGHLQDDLTATVTHRYDFGTECAGSEYTLKMTLDPVKGVLQGSGMTIVLNIDDGPPQTNVVQPIFSYQGWGGGEYLSKTKLEERAIDFPAIVLSSGHNDPYESFFAKGRDFWGDFSLLGHLRDDLTATVTHKYENPNWAHSEYTLKMTLDPEKGLLTGSGMTLMLMRARDDLLDQENEDKKEYDREEEKHEGWGDEQDCFIPGRHGLSSSGGAALVLTEGSSKQGLQLYANSKGWVAGALQGRHSNTSAARQTWFYDWATGALLLADGRQAYVVEGKGVAVAYEGEGKNVHPRLRTWVRGGDGTFSLESDGRQLYLAESEWALVDRPGAGGNTDPARRNWTFMTERRRILMAMNPGGGAR